MVASLSDLVAALGGRLSDEERSQIVGVGESGITFAQMLLPNASGITVQTIRFDRKRSERELAVDVLRDMADASLTLVDDVVVSGRTLEVVHQALQRESDIAAVGLLYDSTRTLRRIGIADVRFGLLYARTGGGTPPINSVDTLQAIPERLDDLVIRYFADAAEAFKRIIRGEE